MRAITEWCGVCLQDDVKVVADKVVNGVPLCKGCDLTYANEPDVLRDAREFLQALDKPEQPSAAPWEPDPPPPPPPAVTHKCICGCGAVVPEGERFAPGHDTPEVKRRVWPSDKPAVVRISNPETILHPEVKSSGFVVFDKLQKRIIRETREPGEVPQGLCGCGCGQPTEIAQYTNRAKNEIAGQPKRFRSGHNRRLLGREVIQSTCATCSKSFEVAGRQNTEGKYCSQECYKNRPRKPMPVRAVKQLKAVPESVCEKCGMGFAIKPGTSGRYCSRACYEGRIVKPELAPVIADQTLCGCGCGKSVHGNKSRFIYGHGKRGWAKSALVAKPIPSTTRTTVDRSITHREVITVEPTGTHAMGRKPVILIPEQKPTSQFQITPEIAQVIWKGMTKEQRYDLLEIDDLWDHGYDDDMRCDTMKNILLVYPTGN